MFDGKEMYEWLVPYEHLPLLWSLESRERWFSRMRFDSFSGLEGNSEIVEFLIQGWWDL